MKFVAFLLTLSTLLYGNASQEKSAFGAISTYLSSYSLSPVINAGKVAYHHYEFERDKNQNITYAFGMLQYEDREYYALFSLNQAGALLEYLASDFPPSTLLFSDILRQAWGLLPEGFNYSYVFIQSEDVPGLGPKARAQKWVFLSPQANREIRVLSQEDGAGGTYFTVQKI